MNDLAERAVERINDLDAFIKRLNNKTAMLDSPPEPSDSFEPVGLYAVERGVIHRVEIAIQAIIAMLGNGSGAVDRTTSSAPEGRWSDLRRIAENQGLEIKSSAPSLDDAIVALERYVSDDTPHLAALVLFIGDLHNKIVTEPANFGFRAPNRPHSDQRSFHFQIKINDDVQAAIKKRVQKVVSPKKTCVAFLNAAFREAKKLV